jgi:transcriptional regulator with XRE-family HTH domain
MGLTQQSAAADLGLSRQAYNNYELGKREPDYETIKRIAGYFSVTADYLLGEPDAGEFFDADIKTNPVTGVKLTAREKRQYNGVLNDAKALFFDKDVSESDKEKVYRLMTDAFWQAKEMNRRKK